MFHKYRLTEILAPFAPRSGVPIAVCQRQQKVAVTLRRDDARPSGEPSNFFVSNRSLGRGPATIHRDFPGKWFGRPYISTERDGYFANRDMHPRSGARGASVVGSKEIWLTASRASYVRPAARIVRGRETRARRAGGLPGSEFSCRIHCFLDPLFHFAALSLADPSVRTAATDHQQSALVGRGQMLIQSGPCLVRL